MRLFNLEYVLIFFICLNHLLGYTSGIIFSNSLEYIGKVLRNILYSFGSEIRNEIINGSGIFNTVQRYGQNAIKENATYDFIIVGAGSAGSVIASRLSEIANWTVLIVEGGNEAPDIVDIPLYSQFVLNKVLDTSYVAQRGENYCRGCENKTMRFRRGKVLGGINFLIHTRGNRGNYDGWEAEGNKGWGYRDVLPYFLKMENASGVLIKDAEYHNENGYLSISDVDFRTPISKVFVEASKEAGYNYVDYNGEQQLGVSWIQATLREGRRCSTEKGYLRPFRHRKNLKILLNATVSKILIDDKGEKAMGIHYTKNNKHWTAYARKEVILSAGSFGSPQLLMISGVGPKKDLEKHNIVVKKDLPVGKTLYDNLIFPALVFTMEGIHGLQPKDLEKPSTYTDYFLYGKGPLTIDLAGEALCFINTNTSNISPKYPDIEILLGGVNLAPLFSLNSKSYSISQAALEKFWSKLEDKNIFQLFPLFLHPYSKGQIKLKSANISEPPLIYPNYLSDKRDVTTFIAAIREAIRLTEQPSFKKYNVTLADLALPGCESYTFNSDDYWACAVHGYAVSIYHHVSTCKMGPKSDPTSVVDERLVLHGMKNLRVADASVMPSTITGHTNAPAVMIGEKVADMIKEDWGLKKST